MSTADTHFIYLFIAILVKVSPSKSRGVNPKGRLLLLRILMNDNSEAPKLRGEVLGNKKMVLVRVSVSR